MIACLAVLASAAPEPPPSAPWTVVRTQHLRVYSDAGEAATDIALQLEAFDALIVTTLPEVAAAQPERVLPLVVFASDAELAASLRHGRRVAPGTVAFHADPARPVAALSAADWPRASLELYAGYLDWLYDLRPRAVPWLRTGLAAYYATMRLDGEVARLGAAPLDRLGILAARRWMPVDDVLGLDRAGAHDLDERQRDLFVAEAWLLVHWCLSDDQRRGWLTDRARTPARAEPVDGGTLWAPSGRTTFEEELESYLAVHDFDELRVDLSPILDFARPEAEPAPPGELAYRLGLLLAHEGRGRPAADRFTEGTSADPASWMPYDGLGMLAMSRQRWGAARRWFRAAIERHPVSAAPFASFGAASLHGLGRRGRAVEAQTALEEAVELDPTQLDAWVALAVYAYDAHDFETSALWAGRGLQADPEDARLRAMLGRAQLADGDRGHAEINAGIALKACDDPDVCALARQVYESARRER